ncbi:DUF512 domain-containing protein [candidate division CSSED10-310 bacterium]|uniref:DUF512 domain-containing protein n=1 Tax=candidate division CSSED10-310 bacterium TaxID=2855610 RepID=A0ABV6Z5K6_UNCC1
MAKSLHRNAPRIVSIAPHSIPQELGWEVGDRICSINGTAVIDILDVLFHEDESELEIALIRQGGEREHFIIEKEEAETLDIDLEPFPITSCQNNCLFCFVHQQPKGLRKSLYVKDEDYRYSFLYGTYVTLSHITSSEIERIIKLRLSPLYISIHATDEAVRSRLFHNKPPNRIMTVLKQLTQGGITIHGQIVICPGINDGDILFRTVQDLKAYFPLLASIAVVPVGLTRHRRGLPVLQRVNKTIATQVVAEIKSVQNLCLQEFGEAWIYLADEFYILAGIPFPEHEHYGEFPQFENGVGMARQFIDQWLQFWSLNKTPEVPKKSALVTGTLFAPIIKNLVKQRFREKAANIKIVPVPNRLFGPSVSVTGLLCGHDVAAYCEKNVSQDDILLPDICFNADGVTLDDLNPEQVNTLAHRNFLLTPATGESLADALAN